MTGKLLEECVAFLAALHVAVPSGPGSPNVLAAQANIVCGACGPTTTAAVRALQEHVEGELADVPRGFAHGDFFYGNLLVGEGSLTGVVDWDAAGPHRLPLVDLLHLLLSSTSDMADTDWGPLLLRNLLPLIRRGGNDAVRAYCDATGITVGRRRMEALVVAYWLDYASYQLRAHDFRSRQSRWRERNIDLVAKTLYDELAS